MRSPIIHSAKRSWINTHEQYITQHILPMHHTIQCQTRIISKICRAYIFLGCTAILGCADTLCDERSLEPFSVLFILFKIGVYPSECLTDNEIECLRGDWDTVDQLTYFAAIPIGIQIFVLVFTMLLIIHSTCIKNNDSDEKAAVALQRHSCTFVHVS